MLFPPTCFCVKHPLEMACSHLPVAGSFRMKNGGGGGEGVRLEEKAFGV